MYVRVRALGQDGMVAQWLYSHIEEMERRYDLFVPMLERHEAYTSMLRLQDSLEECLRTPSRYNNVVRGGRRVGSLDPNTMDFITMLEAERQRAVELQGEVRAVDARFEAARRECLSAESSIRELGLYRGYRLDTGMFN